jgi:hypothetical protein
MQINNQFLPLELYTQFFYPLQPPDRAVFVTVCRTWHKLGIEAINGEFTEKINVIAKILNKSFSLTFGTVPGAYRIFREQAHQIVLELQLIEVEKLREQLSFQDPAVESELSCLTTIQKQKNALDHSKKTFRKGVEALVDKNSLDWAVIFIKSSFLEARKRAHILESIGKGYLNRGEYRRSLMAACLISDQWDSHTHMIDYNENLMMAEMLQISTASHAAIAYYYSNSMDARALHSLVDLAKELKLNEFTNYLLRFLIDKLNIHSQHSMLATAEIMYRLSNKDNFHDLGNIEKAIKSLTELNRFDEADALTRLLSLNNVQEKKEAAPQPIWRLYYLQKVAFAVFEMIKKLSGN